MLINLKFHYITAESVAEGKEEKSIEIVKKMIEKGFSFKDIADTTELPISTI